MLTKNIEPSVLEVIKILAAQKAIPRITRKSDREINNERNRQNDFFLKKRKPL